MQKDLAPFKTQPADFELLREEQRKLGNSVLSATTREM